MTKAKNKEALARALADYQNLIKRTEREKLEIYTRASKNIVEELLPVLDLFIRAQDHLNDSGLSMGLAQFQQVLERGGIEKIETNVADAFDPNIHEVVETVEGGEPGTIAKLVVDGYKWKDGGLLRPVKVIVYNGKQSS